MNIPNQIAKHLKDFYFGGNWTSVNLKDTLNDVSWQQAIVKVDGFNTIAMLVYHINYYIEAVSAVLNGRELDAHDKFSFDCPDISKEEDWNNMQQKVFANAEEFASLIVQLPETKLLETFSDEKYGNYYRNLSGIIEHCHYHLGQIVLLKKMLACK